MIGLEKETRDFLWLGDDNVASLVVKMSTLKFHTSKFMAWVCLGHVGYA